MLHRCCKVCFGSVPCSCFHVFYFEVWLWFLFVSCFPCPNVVFVIGSFVLCVMFSLVVMFIVSCLHWFVLVMCLSVFVISSHVLAFSACRVLMLLPAVGESSPFMPCQVCLLSSLIMFGCLDFTL